MTQNPIPYGEELCQCAHKRSEHRLNYGECLHCNTARHCDCDCRSFQPKPEGGEPCADTTQSQSSPGQHSTNIESESGKETPTSESNPAEGTSDPSPAGSFDESGIAFPTPSPSVEEIAMEEYEKWWRGGTVIGAILTAIHRATTPKDAHIKRLEFLVAHFDERAAKIAADKDAELAILNKSHDRLHHWRQSFHVYGSTPEEALEGIRSSWRELVAAKDAEQSREQMEHARTKAELFAAEQSAKSAGTELHQARMSNSKNLVEIARLKEERDKLLLFYEEIVKTLGDDLVLKRIADLATTVSTLMKHCNSTRQSANDYAINFRKADVKRIEAENECVFLRADNATIASRVTALTREVETWREQVTKLEEDSRGFSVHRLKCELAEAKAQLAHTANCADAYKLQLTAALAQNERMRKALECVASVIPRFTHAFANPSHPRGNTIWLHDFVNAALSHE